MWCDFTTEIPSRAMANQTTFQDFVIPDTVTHIGKEAFMNSYAIKRVYIPKSVVTIERDAFKGCENVEIFCEGEPQKGWVCGMGKEIERDSFVTPEDEAFNFHRSGGSFSSTTIEREVERYQNWNPDGRPVHTHVPESIYKDWFLFRVKYLRLFYLPGCPYCRWAQRAIDELMQQHREFYGIKIDWIDEDLNYGFAQKFDYYYVPSIFDENKKLYEAKPGVKYDELKRAIESSLIKAINE